MGSELERYATIGEIVSVDSSSGIVRAVFPTTEEAVPVQLYDMSLARQGIDVAVGVMFGATLNAGVFAAEDAYPRGLRAIPQLEPGDTLTSLTS